eukprot:NODE_33_length_32023_cov_0.217579.p2 type:complete len:579 gc:universal NODE_33_length_32023_cov_0.217579:24178-22442(-)
MLLHIFKSSSPLEECILIDENGMRAYEDDEKDIFVFPKNKIANIPEYTQPSYPFINEPLDEENEALRLLHIAEQTLLHLKALMYHYNKLMAECHLWSRAAQALILQVNTHPSVLIFNVRPLNDILIKSKDWLAVLEQLDVRLPISKLSDWYNHCEASVNEVQQLCDNLRFPTNVEPFNPFQVQNKDFSPFLNQADMIYTKLLTVYQEYIESPEKSITNESSNLSILTNLENQAKSVYLEALSIHESEYNEFVKRLEAIKEHQSATAIFIRDQKETSMLYESVLADVQQLEILHDILENYTTGVAEFGRRKAWEDQLADLIENASDVLDNALKDEKEKRAEFAESFRLTSSVRNSLENIHWFQDLSAQLPSFNIEFSRDRLTDPPFHQLQLLSKDLSSQCMTYKQYMAVAQHLVNFTTNPIENKELEFLLKENTQLRAVNKELGEEINKFKNLIEWLSSPRTINNVITGSFESNPTIHAIKVSLSDYFRQLQQDNLKSREDLLAMESENSKSQRMLGMISNQLKEYRLMLSRLLAPPRNILQRVRGSFYDVTQLDESNDLMEVLVHFGETVKMVYNKYR